MRPAAVARFARRLAVGALFLSSSLLSFAAPDKQAADSLAPAAPVRESLFPDKAASLTLSHFTWGAEMGSSIDLSSRNLSTFDLDILLGYKNSYINVAGIGAGVHRTIATGTNFIPVYGVLRTSFSQKPSLFFMNLQFGYSFNTIENSDLFGDFSGALGAGINLSRSKMTRSYLLLSVGFRYFNEAHRSQTSLDTSCVVIGRLSVGVNF